MPVIDLVICYLSHGIMSTCAVHEHKCVQHTPYDNSFRPQTRVSCIIGQYMLFNEHIMKRHGNVNLLHELIH